MASVISIINLKGGVGKTTTTVALAEAFSDNMNKRVLIIDLDPQTNATTMLIGEQRWRELNENDYTLARLFKDALDPDYKKFDIDSTLQRRVSDVGAAMSVDLLPSSLDLIDVQDRLASVPSGQFYAVNPIEILQRAVKSKLDEYDLVLIDCPPNLGIITLNGLRISRGYIIPTIPDFLSTYGIPQIVTRVRAFSNEIAEPIVPMGIIVNKYQANSTVHNTVLHQLRTSANTPQVFQTVISQRNQFAAAAEYQEYSRTFKQKYGYGDLANTYLDLAHEVTDRLENQT